MTNQETSEYRVWAKLDAISSAAHYVAREWGDYGYTVEHVSGSPLSGGVILHIVHSDGSRFVVTSDRWGNCDHADSLGELQDKIIAKCEARMAVETLKELAR